VLRSGTTSPTHKGITRQQKLLGLDAEKLTFLVHPHNLWRTKMEQTQKAFRVKEAAQILGVSRSTIRNWIRSGDVRANRVGGATLLVPKSEIERLAEVHDV